MNQFEQYYEQHIASTLTPLEKKRKGLSTLKKRRLKLFNIVIAVLTLVISIYFGFMFSSFWLFFGIGLSALIAVMLFQEQIVAVLLKNDGLNTLKTHYKQKVVEPVIKYFGQDWSYDPQSKIPVDDIKASHLFNIGRNTKVETDDVIRGQLNGSFVLICNLKTTSIRDSESIGKSNISTQSFNGLFVRMTYDTENPLFIVPKAKTSKGSGGLAEMKFTRDHNMTVEEQKAHNLEALSGGMGGYHWGAKMTTFEVDEHEITGQGLKYYLYYTEKTHVAPEVLESDALKTLLSDKFKDQQSLNNLAETKSFTLLDEGLMDNIVQTSMSFAAHSGYVWVLIPAFEKKFELNLDKPIGKATVMKIQRDLQLVMASLQPFLIKQTSDN